MHARTPPHARQSHGTHSSSRTCSLNDLVKSVCQHPNGIHKTFLCENLYHTSIVIKYKRTVSVTKANSEEDVVVKRFSFSVPRTSFNNKCIVYETILPHITFPYPVGVRTVN